jgi:hypothetical protein
MPVRADRSLQLRLEQTAKIANAAEEQVTAVIRYLHSGRTSKLRGGQRLVKLLEVARQRAAEEQEWDVLRGLQESIDYATERVPADEDPPDQPDPHDLTDLRQAIDARDTTEDGLRQALAARPWIFGGRYLDARLLLPDSESDLLVLRGDGSMRIVVVRPAMRIRGLIKRNRGGWSLLPEVHDAAAQAHSYLVSLDENRDWVREQFGVDSRRAGATVLIGHPAVQPHLPEEQINEVLRRFTAQHTRVEVLTYKELADSAERSLSFWSTATTAAAPTRQAARTNDVR